ncbi:MAG TPA: O-antigen ligase family protein [Actinomycetota bacterium]|nr:O-antigen ligase family protein [Actinomycetota bacterium]HNL51446.1 O-antigen ligase family protein [Actinomycetota bacterium]HNO15015.1 O-antigen ligase family protein [Actinomycetota bacterium]
MTEFLPFVALAAAGGLALILWRPIAAVMLFAAMAPLGLTQLPAGVDLVTALSLVVIGAATWDRLVSGASLMPASWAAFAALIWSLGIVGSVAFSSDPGRAGILGVWQIIAAWLAVSIAHLASDPRRMRPALIAVLLGALVVAASGLVGGFRQSGALGAAVISDRAMGVFSQPNEYGLYCAMAWGFALGIACMSQGFVKHLAALTSVLSLAGLALSFSRGAWVGALMTALVMAILVPQTRRPQATALIATVTLLGASLVIAPYWQLPGLLWSRFASIFVGGSNPYDNRPALLREGLRQWEQRPVLGVGPNMYPVESRSIDSYTRTLEGEHAHNLIVTIGAEQGLIGIVALGLFAVAIILAVKAARRFARSAGASDVPIGAAVTLSAMGAMVAVATASVVDYPLRNPLVRGTFWLLLGLLLAGQRCLPAPEDTECSDEPEFSGEVPQVAVHENDREQEFQVLGIDAQHDSG